MKKVLVFAGSNHVASINKQLATYVSEQLSGVEAIILDLNDYEVEIYSPEREEATGIPQKIQDFDKKIAEADGIILSLAEYNGSYAAAFKNILDWITRIDKEAWKNKPMLLMATSPGKRGGTGVLEAAKMSFPHLGGNIVAEYSLPSFRENFSESGISDVALADDLSTKIRSFEQSLA